MAQYKEISEDFRQKIRAHYARPEIQKAMLDAASDKEIVGSFGGTGYAKRPDILQYPEDISSQVAQGITSFHISEETWRNPLELSPGLSKKDLAIMRTTWDLIIDIDCPDWDISKLLTHAIIQEIQKHDVKNVSVKFSGNKGFHIGIPAESLDARPEEFPELPQKIAQYLLFKVHENNIEKEILSILEKKYGEKYEHELEEVFKKPRDILFKHGMLDLFQIIEVDTLLISPRHLYRMVYSVNEKSGLISLPINPEKVLHFEKDIADISKKAASKFTFLDRTTPGDAAQLVFAAREANTQLFAHKDIQDQIDARKPRKNIELAEKIEELYFPDSIKKMLAGNFSDGKKRMMFVLQHFLSSVGWTYDEIADRLKIWNATHTEPLRETVFKGQLNYLQQQLKEGKKMLPPNFESVQYYADLIGMSDDYKKAKNPVSIAKRRASRKKE
jgi:hypothetical protein